MAAAFGWVSNAGSTGVGSMLNTTCSLARPDDTVGQWQQVRAVILDFGL